MSPQRILLTGFMGSGKTTVGERLAELLTWQFTDLDQAIEHREHRTVAEIFAQSGEPHFRSLEHTTLRDLFRQQHLVIALGGGAPTHPPTRELLQKASNTAIVHLDAPFAVLYDRCEAQALNPSAAIRPLLGHRAEAEARFGQRQPLYASLARHTAFASATPDQVAQSIAAALFPQRKQ